MVASYYRNILKRLFKQAWPILISQWAGFAFAIIDSMMLGHFSEDALQTISLAASIYVTVVISLVGMVHALIPIMSQLIGAKEFRQVGHYFGQGIWMAIFVSIIGGLILLYPQIWLGISGDNLSPQVVDHVVSYTRIIFLSLPATLIFRVIYSLCTSSQRTKHVMYISLIGVVLKFGFNWVFIHGHLGFPVMGSDGAALSSALVSWLYLIIGFCFVLLDPFYKQFRLRLGRPRWTYVKEILKLGLPMGGSYFVEVASFTLMALLVARDGVYASGGHQIFANINASLYSIPMAIGVATSSLVAQGIGARKLSLAHNTALTGFGTGFVTAILTVSLVLTFRHNIVAAYTSNPTITQITLGLLMFIPFLHLMDMFQCINGYVLRAHKIATVPFILQSIFLFCLGLGGGYFFGFSSHRGGLVWLSDIIMPNVPMGVASMWIMCGTSLMTCSLILHAFYWHTIRKLRT